MKDEKLYENNLNKGDMLNYKGYFIENGRDEEKKYFEFGAHFSYKELYTVLLKIKLEKEKTEKIVKLKPKKKLNIERINQKDKKIDENINNIIKEFKSKNRSRNMIQQENKENFTKNLNQMTYVPLNLDENKRHIDNHYKANFNSVNKNDKNKKNSMLTNVDNKLRQINKYNYTRNREQKYSFDFPMFFSDNRSMQNDKNMNTNLINNNINMNKITNNINLYKSYQTQIKKRNEVKLNNQIKYNFNKNNLINDKINVSKNHRILSSNENYYLNKYQFRKFKLSPFKQIKTNNNRVHAESYAADKFNIIFKNNNNLTKKLMLKRFINHRSFDFDKINSFSIENKMKYIANNNMIDKTKSLQNNISCMSGNSQNKSKNITYQNMLQNLNQHTKYYNKNMLNNLVKEGTATNYNEVQNKCKIQNLYKILNRNEKMSRNKNINYFLNNTSYINYTHQNDKGNMNIRNNKNIFLDLNNIMMNKEKCRVKLTKNLLNNTRNVTFNNNNKYFNTNYINNTNTQHQNQLSHAFDNNNINLTKNQTAQNNHHNYNNLNVSKNIRKKHKRNNVNISININNNNKIIYNKVYEYKKPYLNINQSKLVKHPIPLRTANPTNNHIKQRVLSNVGTNNINNITKNTKFINIQLPKKKLLNRYNTSNNNNLFSALK